MCIAYLAHARSAHRDVRMKIKGYAKEHTTKKGNTVAVPRGMKWDEDRHCLVRATGMKKSEFKKLYKNHLRERLDQKRS